MRIRAFVATAALFPMFLGACGSDSPSDTTTAATDVAADTAPASTAATSTETTAVAADTVPALPAPTEAASADAASATTAEVSTETTAAAASTDDAILTQMLMGMNNGKQPTAADIACMKKEFPSDKMAKFVQGASGGGTPSAEVLAPLLSAAFKCKPSGLVESLGTSLNDDGSLDGLKPEELTCLSSGVLDLLANEPALMEEFVTSGGSSTLSAASKADLTKKALPTVEKCIKDPEMRKKVIASMNK